MRKWYLAVLRTTLDDLPLLLTQSKQGAMRCAQRTKVGAGEPVCAVLGSDATSPVATWVYVFAHGHLVDAWQVKTF